MTIFKQTPQLFNADHLRTKEWPLVQINAIGPWFLSRPLSLTCIRTRFKLAWKVFTGQYDALSWTGQ